MKKDCATKDEKVAIAKKLHEKESRLKYLLKAIGIAKSTYYKMNYSSSK